MGRRYLGVKPRLAIGVRQGRRLPMGGAVVLLGCAGLVALSGCGDRDARDPELTDAHRRAVAAQERIDAQERLRDRLPDAIEKGRREAVAVMRQLARTDPHTRALLRESARRDPNAREALEGLARDDQVARRVTLTLPTGETPHGVPDEEQAASRAGAPRAHFVDLLESRQFWLLVLFTPEARAVARGATRSLAAEDFETAPPAALAGRPAEFVFIRKSTVPASRLASGLAPPVPTFERMGLESLLGIGRDVVWIGTAGTTRYEGDDKDRISNDLAALFGPP